MENILNRSWAQPPVQPTWQLPFIYNPNAHPFHKRELQKALSSNLVKQLKRKNYFTAHTVYKILKSFDWPTVPLKLASLHNVYLRSV